MTDIKPRPCPFCGREVKVALINSGPAYVSHPLLAYVECSNEQGCCFARGPVVPSKGGKESERAKRIAVTLWNAMEVRDG